MTPVFPGSTASQLERSGIEHMTTILSRSLHGIIPVAKARSRIDRCLPIVSKPIRLWDDVLVLLLFTVCFNGCSERSDLGGVSGTVTLDGKPLPDASLEFVPQGPGTISFGKTDEDGTYSMVFSRTDDGAMLGETIVRISTTDVYVEDGRTQYKPELVPPKYNSHSELKVTVEPEQNVFDFDLSTAGESSQ